MSRVITAGKLEATEPRESRKRSGCGCMYGTYVDKLVAGEKC